MKFELSKGLCHLRSERGAMLITSAIIMVGLLGVVSLSVDLGVMYVKKQTIVNLADAAALAGASQLPDEKAAVDAVNQLFAQNGVNTKDPKQSWDCCIF